MNVRIVLIRLVQGVITTFLVFTAVFFIMRLSGDPTLLFLPPDATQEDIDRFRAEKGWDQRCGGNISTTWVMSFRATLASR